LVVECHTHTHTCISDLLLCIAAFSPFHIGNFAVTGLRAQELVSEDYCC